MLLDLLNLGQTYDACNANKFPGMSRASFDKWTLKVPMLHFQRMVKSRRPTYSVDRTCSCCQKKEGAGWHFDEAVIDLFHR